MINNKIRNWVLLFFLLFTIFLTLNRHNKSGIQNYHCEIWADKAGYYIYLPALFIYDFKSEKLPLDIDKKTGSGFHVKNGKIITKYSYGVALMQSPFFITTYGISKLFGFNDDGFSLVYHKMIDISAVLYSFFALIFLYLFLIRHLSKNESAFTVICLYLGTNIFYYSIFDTGMSHIYSFFLFTSLLYLGPFLNNKGGRAHFVLFGLIVGLIVAVRPLNVIFIPIYFILNSLNLSHIKRGIKNYILAFITAFIVLIPQLIYWKYSYGNYLHYSYEGESFSNILHPKLINLWFSTNNGLFVYNPIIIFVLIGLFYYYKEARKNSIVIGTYFLLISFVFSAWHDWGYGCSYGCRPYVEYYSIFALPFGFFMRKLIINNSYRLVLLSLLVVSIIYNQKLIFSFDGCWYGGIWDWSALIELLFGSTK